MIWSRIVMAAVQGRGPLRHARAVRRRLLGLRLPVFRPFWSLVYTERELRRIWMPILLKILYREPIMRYRCARVGKRLNMYGAVPLIFGTGRIEIGDDVHLDGRNTWVVGSRASMDARLIIGDRVVIGYQNYFSVAKQIVIGDDTLLASNVQIYDNINHPIEPDRRLHKESITLDEAAPVTIGRNVWLATGCIIMKGVTIGDGSVVGAGSVVTRDVPPNALAAGNPARVVRTLEPSQLQQLIATIRDSSATVPASV